MTGSGGHGGPQLTFRRAGLDDFSTIRHVHAAAIRSLGDKVLDDTEVTSAIQAVYSPSYIADLSAKSVLVALLNGDLVATCAWGPNDDRGTAARISSLFVLPLFQGNGVGRQLIAQTEKAASQNGFDVFSVTAPVSLAPLFTQVGYALLSYGTSRDVVPTIAIQVAFLRKP